MKNVFPSWRRIFAFIIDTIVLGIAGMILGFSLSGPFESLGLYGRFVGLIIAVLYFGLLNSRLGRGQTLGKKFLKIKVVNSKKEFLSVPQAIVRAFILYFPVTISGFFMSVLISNFPLGMFLIDIFMILVLVTIYLIFFNSPAKRVLHDLIVNSYVINAGAEYDELNYPLNKKHFIFLGVIILLVIVLSAAASLMFGKLGLKTLLETSKYIQRTYNVRLTGVSFNYQKNFNTGRTTGMVAVGVMTKDIVNKPLAQNIARAIYDRTPNINDFDVIYVTLTRGYDIGISSGYTSASYSFPVNKQTD